MNNYNSRFYLKIYPSNDSDKQKGPCGIILNFYFIAPYSIYSSYLFPENNKYKYITSLFPSDSLIISNEDLVTGLDINKQIVTKDDLYQYYFDNNNFALFQFTQVFSDLISNEYIYNTLYSNQSNETNLCFIFGSHSYDFIKDMIIQMYKERRGQKGIELSISCYNIQRIKKSLGFRTLGSLKDIKVNNRKEIDCCIQNCKNESRLLDINESGTTYIMVQNNDEVIGNFVVISQSYSLDKSEVKDYIECLEKIKYRKKKKLNVIMYSIIENNDTNIEDTDNEKIIDGLFNMQTAFSPKEEKENVIDENVNNEGIKEIDASTLSVSLSQFKMSQMKDNQKLMNNNDKSELIDCKNELMLVRQEKEQLEQLVKLLEESLKLERKEKLGLINENAMLKQKLQKLTKTNKN